MSISHVDGLGRIDLETSCTAGDSVGQPMDHRSVCSGSPPAAAKSGEACSHGHAGRGWHSLQDLLDRRPSAIRHAVYQLTAWAGQGQQEVPAVRRVVPTVRQPAGDQSVAGPGGIGRMNLHRFGQGGQVHRTSAGHDHQRSELSEGDGVLDRGQ